MTSVCVIGGGLVGLSTALMLSERGAEVTVLDSASTGGGASQGNAGYYCTQMLAPLAAPGQISSALKSLRDPSRPLRVRPQALPSMLTWGVRFAAASTPKRYEAGRAALIRFNAHNHDVLAELTALGVETTLSDDIVAPFHSEDFAKHFVADLSVLREFGIPAPTELLDASELKKMIPALSDHVTCGIVIQQDRALDPRSFTTSMIGLLRARGVRIVESSNVTAVDVSGGTVRSLTTSAGRFDAGEFVIAAGAGARRLGKLFNLNLPVVPGTGYNVAIAPHPGLTRPVIFEEPRVAVTPMRDQIRLGGTMEFGGDNASFDQRRVDAIKTSLARFVELDLGSSFNTWSGARPLTPDGLPMIGRTRAFDNVTVAVGHGMFGLTLAPATGRAVAELITEGRTAAEIAPFDPDRFRSPLPASATSAVASVTGRIGSRRRG